MKKGKTFVDRFQSNNSILRLFAIIQVAHVFGYQSLNDFFHSTMDILIPLFVAGGSSQVAVCIEFVAQKFKQVYNIITCLFINHLHIKLSKFEQVIMVILKWGFR